MIEETITYKGFTINVHYDDCASNPMKDFDCEPPTLVASLNHARWGFTSYGLEQAMPDLTREEVKANAEEIALVLGGYTTLLRAVRDYFDPQFDGVEVVNSALHEHFIGSYTSDQLELIEQAWKWKGCVTSLSTHNGYCQGDTMEILCVATPEWLETTGLTADDPEALKRNLKATADQYADWAFGNVYGYTIDDQDGEKTEESCWGFYGTNHEQSGLLEYAKNAIDCLA